MDEEKNPDEIITEGTVVDTGRPWQAGRFTLNGNILVLTQYPKGSRTATSNVLKEVCGVDLAKNSYSCDMKDTSGFLLKGSDGSVSVYSASGDCAIQYRGKNRGLDIRTSSGDITLVVPEELDAKIECTSGSGVVTTSFPSATVLAKSATNYEAALNGGGEKIILRTQSGIIDAAVR